MTTDTRPTDRQIENLWLYRKNIHGGELMPQLQDFARAVLALSEGKGGSQSPQAAPAVQAVQVEAGYAADTEHLNCPHCNGSGHIDDVPAAQSAAVDAVRDVIAERERQKTAEGWTPEHDDQHANGSLSIAAACYAAHTGTDIAIDALPDLKAEEGRLRAAQEFVSRMWPWARKWWKPKDRRANLVRAGALILAEIERLDRAALSQSAKGAA